MSKNTVFVKLNKHACLYNLWRNGKTKLISLKGHQDLNATRKDYQNPFKTRQEGHQNPFKIYQVLREDHAARSLILYYSIGDFTFTRL